MKYLGLWSLGYEKCFEKFVKPSGPLSYILNVCSLNHGYMLQSSYIEGKLLCLLPFFMAVATYCYYAKVRRMMRTAIVLYLIKEL